MKNKKKYKNKEVMEKARRYELTDIVKEAMCQGVMMEQMYGAERDNIETIEEDDPVRLTNFILENVDKMRKDMKMFKNKTVH